MKLRALELEQFRKFERPVRLSEFSDGLNLLCGPNELGKSTILKAIQGLLFERHGSKADPVKKMQPWLGDAAPRLAMEFELDGGRWRIEKRFVHKPWARLTSPSGHCFEGDTAEEELQRLLGFGAAGKRGSTTDQHGVWGALWVTQRRSVEQADLSSDLARASITNCLDTEVGVLTGSERGQAIMRAARGQLDLLIDRNRKPRGRYKEVMAGAADADTQLGTLRERKQRLSEDSDALRLNTAQLAKADDPAAIQRDQEALDDARRRREAAQQFNQKRKTAVAEHELAQHNREAADREHSTRQARRTAIKQKESAQRDAAAATEDARTQANETDAVLTRRRDTETDLEARATETARDVRRRRDGLTLAQHAASLTSLETQLNQAEAAQNDITRLLAALQSVRIDKDGIAELRQAVNERDKTQSALQAQATAIEFDLEPEAAHRITLDGADLRPGHSSVLAVADTRIAIAGVGRIVVRPAIRDRDKLTARATKTISRVEELLAACGCRDPEEAEAKWVQRQELEASLRDARVKLDMVTPGESRSDLAPGLEALRQRIEVLRLRIEVNRNELGLTDLPVTADAERAVRAADTEDIRARDELAQARAELNAAIRSDANARNVLLQAESTAKAAQTELDRLRREDATAAMQESDDALTDRLAAAQQQLASRTAGLEELDRTRPADTVEAMDARIQRYQQALDNRAESIRELSQDIAVLRDRITREGGAGLDENIAVSERQHDALTRERDTLERDVQALTFLLEALTTAERETKEAYLTPVVRRVTPYLCGLFPGATITCDDTLQITGLARDGSGLQAFDGLSDGTQEQIAVLARLAFAELLTDQGKPAMVILDDALAYSDDERIERMFDILAQAAAHTQILVLTCRESLFARLGGNRLQLTPTGPAPGL